MDICKVYIVDSTCPSNFMISAEGELFKLLYQDYHGVFSHIPFVHQEYTDYWERGVLLFMLLMISRNGMVM